MLMSFTVLPYLPHMDVLLITVLNSTAREFIAITQEVEAKECVVQRKGVVQTLHVPKRTSPLLSYTLRPKMASTHKQVRLSAHPFGFVSNVETQP